MTSSFMFINDNLPAGISNGNVMIFALAVAVLLLFLQVPIAKIAFKLLNSSADVENAARTYFYICIWGAPAVLLLYAFNGWFIGLQSTKITMFISLIQNLSNIVLSLLFVFGFGMEVAGVALGTLLAQYIGLVMKMCGAIALALACHSG